MKSLTFFSCLFALGSAFALDLDLSGKAYLPPNSILSPHRAGMAVQAKADSLRPSDIAVLRQKNEQGQYVFFEGRIQRAARETLTFFQPTAQDAWGLMLHARFYSSNPVPQGNEPATPPSEITQVFWDGAVLAVAGESDSLYAQTEVGTSLFLAVSGEPVAMQIETTPRGAVVRVGDVILGATPLRFQWLNGRWALVRLEKLGYFTWENVVEADPNQVLDLKINLVERPSFQDGTMADSNGMDAHGTMDFNAVEALISKITSTKITRESQDAVQWLNTYLDTLRARQYVEYIPPQNLSVEEWDAQKVGMPVHLWYGSNDFDFGFTGLIPCSQDEAYALTQLMKATQRSATLKSSVRSRRASWPSAHATSQLDGFVRLKYRNWLADTRTQSRNVKRYFALESLELVLPGTTIAIPGTFLPPAYITKSEQWMSFIEDMKKQQSESQVPVAAPQ